MHLLSSRLESRCTVDDLYPSGHCQDVDQGTCIPMTTLYQGHKFELLRVHLLIAVVELTLIELN